MGRLSPGLVPIEDGRAQRILLTMCANTYQCTCGATVCPCMTNHKCKN